MEDEIFTTVKLPMGGEAVIFEGKGIHYFSALKQTKGDSNLIMKYLILEIVKVNGKKLTEEELDNLNLRGVMYLMTVINTMLSNDFNIF